MRDVERLREKIQLSLDDRQVAALAVCALLLLGGVFSLGLLVGKRLAAAAPQAAKLNDLAALDEQQEQRLAQPGNAPRPPSALPPPAPVAVAAKAPPDKPPDELDRDPDEQPVAEQGKPPEESPPLARTGATSAKPPQSGKPPQPAQTAQVQGPRAPVEIDPPPKPRTVEPAPSAVALTAPPRNLGQFTVQLGASQDRADAQRLEARARGAGLKPYVVEARLGNKGTWYRVRVGAFNDKDTANNFRQDVERELRLTAMVMPTR